MTDVASLDRCTGQHPNRQLCGKPLRWLVSARGLSVNRSGKTVVAAMR